MKTLLLALISPGKGSGTREGAIRGLVGVGKEAVRKGLVEGGGAKVVAAEWEADGRQSPTLFDSVLVSRTLLLPLRVVMALLSLGCITSSSARIGNVRCIGSLKGCRCCYYHKPE